MLKKMVSGVLIAVILLSGLTACKQDGPLDPKNPVEITVWHYYNSSQLVAFQGMVDQFNQTVGKDLGIRVQEESQGGVNDLAQMIFDVAAGVAGDAALPDIFAAYPDTAYEVKELGLTADLGEYITSAELEEYVDSFWREGVLPPDDVATIFPIAKSTELLQIDAIAWEQIKADIPAITDDNLATWEGIAQAAQLYFEYTDGQTPDVEGDGSALFGLDSTANYLFVAMRQQGVTFLENQEGRGVMNLDEAALRRAFDLYYGSMVKGYFSNKGRYRSDDVTSGEIIGFIGSSTGSMYFPEQITFESGNQREADLATYPMPTFADGAKVAIQQGAGMVVTKSEEKREYASVEFLKWLTQQEQNLRFAVDSTYLPVKTEVLYGSEMESILGELEAADDTGSRYAARMFRTVLQQSATHEQFYTTPFPGLYETRRAMDGLEDYAKDAREQVVQLVESGESYQDAVDAVLTDAAFDNWLEEFRENTLAYLG